MTSKPHVCSICKKEVVWTDCLPATCYLCNDKQGETSRKQYALMTQDLVKCSSKLIEEQGSESQNG